MSKKPQVRRHDKTRQIEKSTTQSQYKVKDNVKTKSQTTKQNEREMGTDDDI